MKQAWVLGAHGFLGRHVARHLAAAGWRVAGIGHGPWSNADAKGWGIDHWVPESITVRALTAFQAVVGDPDLVFHAAGGGSVGASIQQPYHDFERTVGTTAAVLEFLRLCAPRAVLIYPSSAAVYGVVRSGPIAEDSPLRPVSPYGTHKLMAEQLCQTSARQFGLRVGIIRFFSLYGPGLCKQLLWDVSQRLSAVPQELTMAGTGDETRDFLHVEDASRLVSVMASHVSGDLHIVNGGTGVPIRVREVVEECVRQMGVPTTVSFTGLQRPGDPAHFQADISRILALGFSPIWSWHDGVADYLKWRGVQGMKPADCSLGDTRPRRTTV